MHKTHHSHDLILTSEPVSPRPDSALQCAYSLQFVTALLSVFLVQNDEIPSSTRLNAQLFMPLGINLISSACQKSRSRFWKCIAGIYGR